MATCKNEITQYIPKGYDYKAVKSVCGQTGYYGTPIYCDTCEAQHEAQGHTPTQCKHGAEMFPEDGRDVMCIHCELGE